MRPHILFPLFLLTSAGLLAQASKPEVLARIDAGRAPYEDIALKIWDFAEVGYRELRSSALLQERLKQEEAVRVGLVNAVAARDLLGEAVAQLAGDVEAHRVEGVLDHVAG